MCYQSGLFAESFKSEGTMFIHTDLYALLPLSGGVM